MVDGVCRPGELEAQRPQDRRWRGHVSVDVLRRDASAWVEQTAFARARVAHRYGAEIWGID